MNLKQQIEQVRAEHDALNIKLQQLLDSCEHETVVKLSCDSAQCDICQENLGWYCPDPRNPVRTCEYDWDENGEDCIYCGAPEERK
ncbi:hypothetical protein [Metabacillus sp. SLBN-84]